jgi:hypothetical protein
MNEQQPTELSRCLLAYGQAIAHKATLEAALLLGYTSANAASDADVLLRRAAQDLAAALGAEIRPPETKPS